MEKMNKKLVTEIAQMKSWMKFLDNKSNHNTSFHKPTSQNPKLMRESMFDDNNDQYGSPEENSDNLILGGNEEGQDIVNDGNFIVISIDINGGIHATMVEAEDENAALEQTENEMIIQSMVISEDSLMEMISKLSQFLPEDITSGEEFDKPPFIDEPTDKVIDEDEYKY